MGASSAIADQGVIEEVVVTATKTADEVREAIEKTGKVAVLVGSGSSTGKIM